jgi:hypothetical protein
MAGAASHITLGSARWLDRFYWLFFLAFAHLAWAAWRDPVETVARDRSMA